MKKVTIITTASIPWFTGTAINPLYRAITLSKIGFRVTLYIPYVTVSEQKHIFGKSFYTQNELREYIVNFTPGAVNIEICFYNAKCRLDGGKPSLFPSERIDKLLTYTDNIILEEPEHLLWFKPLQNFKSKSKNVLGIIHTNYLFYIRNSGYNVIANLVKYYSKVLLKWKCSKVVHLSSVTEEIFPNDNIFPLNGVRREFFIRKNEQNDQNGIYTYGKVIFEKGFKELIDLMSFCGYDRPINCYGNGYDKEKIIEYASHKNIRIIFYDEVDKPYVAFNEYKIFINTSVSEVLCTSTAEAVAMGKGVIIPKHASNELFYRYNNVFAYGNMIEFKKILKEVENLNLKIDNIKLRALSWGAVTRKYLLPMINC